MTEACLEDKIVLQYWLAGGWIVSQYKNCIVIEAGKCCIAIQSLGHKPALGRALGAQAGVRGAHRCAGGGALVLGAQAGRWASRRCRRGAGRRRQARARGGRVDVQQARGRGSTGARGERQAGAGSARPGRAGWPWGVHSVHSVSFRSVF